MLNTIDPSRICTENQQLSRRDALFGLGAAATLAPLTGCATSPPDKTARASMGLDFRNPEDNLTAWVKLVSSLEDGVETCGYFGGTQYAVIGTQEVIKPLFRIAGFGMSRVTLWKKINRLGIEIPH